VFLDVPVEGTMIQTHGWATHPDLTELDKLHANTCQKVERK